MKYEKYLIIFLLIILLSLSGCLEFITTEEKQACLALTHFSSTSIEGCLTQNSCFKQVDSLKLYVSKHTPYEINNDVLAYKNYVASSYFYYTKTAKKLNELNIACNDEKPKEIIKSINELMFYFSETALYLDYFSKESINIIKNYTLFLESQDIDLIREENIYDDYILLNQNLNQLKENKINNTYLSNLDLKIKELHKFAESIGFRQTYLSKENISDLSLYYLKIYEEEVNSHEIYVPELFGSTYFILNKFSNIMDLRQINLNLNKVDSYNFYNVMNRFIGKDNSLLIDFKEINNRVNYNLDEIYLKITEMEDKIDFEKEYLIEEDYLEFKLNKIKFKNKEISFGYYLSFLKKINNDIEKNKIDTEIRKEEEEKELSYCDKIISDAKNYQNIFYKTKVREYEETDNFLEKINICNRLIKIINEGNCFEKIDLFLETEVIEKKEFELIKISDENSCKEILGNINYKLETNDKIILLSSTIEKLKIKIIESKPYILDYKSTKEILDIKQKIDEIEDKDNLELILNIDDLLNSLIEDDKKIKLILVNILKQQDVFIKSIFEKHYLVINNPFSISFDEVELSNKYSGLENKTDEIIIKNNLIKINKLFPGENLFLVDYNNKKEIAYEIIYLSLNESIIKIIIKNQIEGIFDSFKFIDGFYTNSLNVTIDGDKITYITEKENEIYLIGDVFEKQIITKVNEISDDKIIIIEDYIIKNRFDQKINHELELKSITDSDVYFLTENKKEILTYNKNNLISFYIDISPNEIKNYNLQLLTNKQNIFNYIQELQIILGKASTTRFENIKKESENIFKDLLLIKYKEEYTFQEINLFLDKVSDIEKIKLKLNTYENIEKSYFLKYNELFEYKLTTKETSTLDKINKNKLNDMLIAEKEINLLLIDVRARHFQENKLELIEEQEKINKLKDTVTKYNLNINFDNSESVLELQEKVNLQLKTKANEVKSKIDIKDNKSIQDISEIINKVYLLYEDYSLRDLYNLGYFLNISENDAKRLEKNIIFLDSVTFNKEKSNFEENYNDEEYEKAINSISLETINRINKINNEIELIENGLKDIRELAKKEIQFAEETKLDSETLTISKTYFDEEKYLNSIILIKNQEVYKKTNKKTSQIVISLSIIIIFSLIYLYLKIGVKKKEEDRIEKKKKIIRQ